MNKIIALNQNEIAAVSGAGLVSYVNNNPNVLLKAAAACAALGAIVSCLGFFAGKPKTV